jgi:hypothetical protein
MHAAFPGVPGRRWPWTVPLARAYRGQGLSGRGCRTAQGAGPGSWEEGNHAQGPSRRRGRGSGTGVAGAVAIPVASQAAGPGSARSRTLVFHVAFSPPEFVPANNIRNPHSQFALGGEIVFHDQLFSDGQHVGDEGGSCVLVDVSQGGLANCSEVIRLPGGTVTGQFLNAPPPRKQIAITGGTGVYDAAGGEGTLVEFGTFNGRLTLHLLSLLARGG